jgi:cell division protein FtsQ
MNNPEFKPLDAAAKQVKRGANTAAPRLSNRRFGSQLGRIWFSTLCITAVGILAVVGFGVWRAKAGHCVFPLKTMVIESHFERLSAEQIRAAGKGLLDAGFFSVDLSSLRGQIQALPWVEQVEVRKRWPDTILVRVLERNAVARWNDTALLNARGDVFTVDGAADMRGLVRLSGPDSHRSELVRFYYDSEPMLRNLSLHLKRAHFSERGALTAYLSDGSKIILGREQLRERWQRLVENLPTLQQKNQGQRLLEVDLRYTNGLAARFENPAPAAPTRAPSQAPSPSAPIGAPRPALQTIATPAVAASVINTAPAALIGGLR